MPLTLKSMGKRLVLIAAILAGLVLLLLVALAVALPQWVEAEAFQEGLRARASTALGADVEWGHAEIGLLPPRVTLDSLELREAGGSAAARLRAESVDLRISLWPLFSRRVEMGSLVFYGVDLVVTREDEGWVWPIQIGGKQLAGESDGSSVPQPEPAETEHAAAGAVALTLGQVRLSEAQVLIRDRTLGRQIDWQLSELSFEAKEQAESGRYAIQFESDLAAGSMNMGTIEGDGGFSLGAAGLGDFAVEVDLKDLRVDELVSYLPVASASGRLSGQLAISGHSTQISEIGADLLAEEWGTRVAGVELGGRLTVKGAQRPGAPSNFEIGIDSAAGGRVDIQGSLAPGGALGAKAQLKQFDSAALKSIVGEGRSVSGSIDGEISLDRRGDGSFSAFRVNLVIGSFGYADATHRLQAGDLDVDLAFKEGRSGGGRSTEYALRSTLGDARGRQPASGPRRVEGRLEAKLSLDQANLAELPFGLTIEALPTGFLTGVVTVQGALQSVFPVEETGMTQTALDVEGDFKLDAGMGAAGPIDLETRLAFEDGGVIEAKGQTSREGVLDLNTRIEAFDLKRIGPFLSDGEFSVGGTLSGTGRWLGPATSPSRLVLNGQIEAGEMTSGEYQVTGPFGFALSVTSPLSDKRKGSANLDLTKAKLLYEGRFEKKPGVPAQLDTDFSPNAVGVLEFESRLKLKKLEKIQIRGALGEDRAITLSATSLDLGQVAEFVPVLAEYRATGRASLAGFSVQQPAASAPIFAGKLSLADVAVSLPEGGRVGLAGAVLGDGNRLRTEALQLIVNDVKVELEGHLEDPLGEGRFSFSGRTLGTPEVNDLLSALTSKRDTVFGPLQLSGDVSGALSTKQTVADSLVGTLQFSVGEDVGGILRGVSLLKSVLNQMPILGSAVWSKPFRGGRSVEDFFSDRFEVMQGKFSIEQGAIDAKTLRLVYKGYEADLSGRMKLGDLSLDMTGELLLTSDLIAVLMGALGRDGTNRKPVQIPLARVSNTLSAPKVSMTPRTLAVIPEILIQATGLGRLKDGLEEGLGKVVEPIRPYINGNP